MKVFPVSDKIYVKQSGIINSGRGVYAKCDIKKGELIEKCPVIEIPKHDTASLRETILVTYFFYFGKNKERLAVALGYGSLYNHSRKPNAKYKIIPKENMIDIIALNNIKKDDEIVINYNPAAPKNKNPLWFE
jgi:uncharacterized protein